MWSMSACEPAVGAALVAVSPIAQPAQVVHVLVGERREGALGLLEGLELGLVDLALFESSASAPNISS